MKNITRTITIYTYVFAPFDASTMEFGEIERVERPYKLGEREKRRLEKQIGKTFLTELKRDQLYSISVEDFVRYATPVDGKEDEDNE